MNDPRLPDPPPTPRRGKRIMWVLGVLVLLALGYTGYTMSQRGPGTVNPGMSQEGSALAPAR